MTPWWYFRTVSGIVRLNSSPFLSRRDADEAVESFRLTLKSQVRVQILQAKAAPELDEIVWDQTIHPE